MNSFGSRAVFSIVSLAFLGLVSILTTTMLSTTFASALLRFSCELPGSNRTGCTGRLSIVYFI